MFFNIKRSKNKFLGKNITYLLEQFNMDIKNLSLETGIPTATIARMRKKDSNPTISSIEPLAEFFRTNIDVLLYEDMESKSYQARHAAGSFVHIPILSMEELESSSKSKITKFIGAAGISGENVFGIQLTTETLAPAFQNNSILIIDPDLEPKEGDHVICTLEDDSDPVFRQVFMDGRKYFFKPVNPGFGEMKQYNNFKILGVIIKSIEDFR